MKLSASTSAEENHTKGYAFRPIQRKDNGQVAKLIRQVMVEFGCFGEGYSINDPEIDDMFGEFNKGKAAFYVVTRNGEDEIVGCGGVAPLSGGEAGTCELKKMYFHENARGRGLGRQMVELCLNTARQFGYRRCYLETVDRMAAANILYQKMAFKRLDSPMGNTGHCSCEGWYARDL